MNRSIVSVSLLFVSLFAAPQFAAAADGGGKTKISVGEEKPPAAPVVSSTPAAAPNQCSAELAKATAELTSSQASLNALTSAQKELVAFVKNGCRGDNPVVETKPVKPRKVIPDVLICKAPANKMVKAYCDCLEDGVPARVVDSESPAFNRHIVKGVCVTPYDVFQTRIAELKEMISKVKNPVEREAPSREIAEILLWYRSLITSQTPLTAENWQEASDSLDEVKGRLNALEKRMNDMEARQTVNEGKTAKLEEQVAHLADPIDVMVGARSGFNIRPGAGVESFTLSAEAQLTFWVQGSHGIYMGGFAGLTWNSDVNRYAAGGRLGYANALRDDRSLVLRLGGVAGAEPRWQGVNDSTIIGGEVGLDIRPGGGPFTLGFGFLMGTNSVALYRPIAGGGQARQISGWGLVLTPSIVLGLTY